jgi:hypothetical protein
VYGQKEEKDEPDVETFDHVSKYYDEEYYNEY